ncbi:hypothetical protein [Pyrodictium abyssi]|uniref:hypothetical protein n=1 Tax=Pyrodictium abyssi TaxID=54256 RepID=UPI0030C72BFB
METKPKLGRLIQLADGRYAIVLEDGTAIPVVLESLPQAAAWGGSLEAWRRMEALRVPESGEDRYVPPVEQVRTSLPRLRPRYRLVYYVLLYTAARPEHVLRLLGDWGSVAVRTEPIAGGCLRIVAPPGWPEKNPERTCGTYVSYLRKFRWPLRREDLYTMKLNKWHVLALRNYLRFLEEQGGGSDPLPEPDYELFRRWCIQSKSKRQSHKHVYGFYMPGWLYEAVNKAVEQGYRPPRRDKLAKHAAGKGAPAPKYIRKFSLHHIARMLGPQAAAHVGGHDPGAELIQIPSAVKTKTTEENYISLEDLVKMEYHRFARWLEENVAPRSLLLEEQ